MNTKIGSLNQKQREVFDVVHDWTKRSANNLSSISTCVTEPLQIFVTDNAGCGKSFLTKVLFQSLTKTFSYRNAELDKPNVLLPTPTGLESVNIDGTTTHTGLGIPIGNFGSKLPSLSDKMKSNLRNKLFQVKWLIIDEISMVSNDLLLHVNCRVVEIFGCRTDIPFVEIIIIAVGDILQLPPVRTRTVYSEYKSDCLNFAPLWELFKTAKLNEVMRQRGDAEIIDLLSHIRVTESNSCDLEILKSKFIFTNSANYPRDALHIFRENITAAAHNTAMLQPNINKLHSIEAIDILPRIFDQQKLSKS